MDEEKGKEVPKETPEQKAMLDALDLGDYFTKWQPTPDGRQWSWRWGYRDQLKQCDYVSHGAAHNFEGGLDKVIRKTNYKSSVKKAYNAKKQKKLDTAKKGTPSIDSVFAKKPDGA